MLRIVGDINFTDSDFNVGFGIGTQLASGLDPLASILTNKDDLWIGNFEGVASNVSENVGIYSRKFRVSPANVLRVKNCNIYGVANNHIMQHGPIAFADTINTILSTGGDYFGSNDKKTHLFIHQGRKVSITGLSYRIEEFNFIPSYWHNPELSEIEKEFKKLPADAFKIIYLHWGNEFVSMPSTNQKQIAHWLIDIGFDLVIGMHPHVLQPYECYQSKYIFYSIGNFVFDMAYNPTQFGSIVNVDFSHWEAVVSYDYIKINRHFTPEIISKEDVPEKYRFDYLNNRLCYDYNPEVYNRFVLKAYKNYRKANRVKTLKDILTHPVHGVPIFIEFLNRKIRNVK